MSAIPGQPYFSLESAFNTPFGSGVQPFFTDLTNRWYTELRCQRGQQYERQQAQAGTLSVGLNNRDGYLDPSNSSSPYNSGAAGGYPQVDLYRAIRLRAQYPQTQNLLTGDQATAGEATPIAPGAIPASMNVGSAIATPTLVASATAFQGTQVYQVSVPASASSGFFVIDVQFIPVQTPSSTMPTATYSWSIRVRSLTAGANPSLGAAVKWFNGSGGVVSTTTGTAAAVTGSATAAWTEFTVSASPPTGALYAEIALALAATGPGVAWTFQADGLQWEIGTAPTTWTQPGNWYGVWAGAYNALPRVTGKGTPDSSGNYSILQVNATDVLGILSQAKLNDCYINTLLSYGPDALWPLNDPGYPSNVSQQWQEWTGNRGAAGEIGSAGGVAAAGQSLGDGMFIPSGYISGFYGTNGPVVTTSGAAWGMDSSSTDNIWGAGGVSLGTATQVGPPPSSAWTRVFAVGMLGVETVYLVPTGTSGAPNLRCMAWSCVGPAPNGYPQISLSAFQPITWSGGIPSFGTEYMLFEAYSAAGVHITQQLWVGNTPTRLDSQYWTLVAISLSANGQTFTIQIGAQSTGATYSYTVSTGGVDFRTTSATSYVTDVMGCWHAPWQPFNTAFASGAGGTGPFQWGMNGQIGPVAEYDFAITSAQFADMWESFQNAYSGDTTGQRVQRFLGWGGYAGASTVDTGSSTVGPAGGLGSSNGPWTGTDPLSGMQPLVLLEHGAMYPGPDGSFVFRGRNYRFTQASPAATFGEGPPVGASGEIPYTYLPPGYDNVEVINQVLLNCQSGVTDGSTGDVNSTTSVPISAFNQSSIARYFPQTVNQTINPGTYAQAQSLAQWLVNSCGQPHDRLTGLIVTPSSTAGIWAQCLGLDLNELIQANRRPLGGAALSIPAYTEQLAWSINPNGPIAMLTIQASPAALDSPWLVAPLHSTLNAQAATGANSMTINAFQDASTNELGWWVFPGHQFVMEPGTARQETVTVKSPVPATSLGWTTATLPITGTFAFTHPANSPFASSPLPAGTTNVAQWDDNALAGVTTIAGF